MRMLFSWNPVCNFPCCNLHASSFFIFLCTSEKSLALSLSLSFFLNVSGSGIKITLPDCVQTHPVQSDGCVHLQYKQIDLNLVILCCGLYFSPPNFVTEHEGLECLCQAWSAKLAFFLLTSLTWDATLVYLDSVMNPQGLPGLYCRCIQPCCLFILTWKLVCSFGLNLKLTLTCLALSDVYQAVIRTCHCHQSIPAWLWWTALYEWRELSCLCPCIPAGLCLWNSSCHCLTT